MGGDAPVSTGGAAAQRNGRGLGVDARGDPVIDPTANVIALVEAETKRADDLRVEINRRIEADLRHQERVADLRAMHQRELDEKESSRLDSIRQVDVLAVNTAAERSLAAIQTLAATTAANADNLRNALNTTAATIAKQLADTVQGINERLSALERSSYEIKGRSTVSDPMISELVAKVDSLLSSRSVGTGKSAGYTASWGLLVGLAGFAAALGSIITFFVSR